LSQVLDAQATDNLGPSPTNTFWMPVPKAYLRRAYGKNGRRSGRGSATFFLALAVAKILIRDNPGVFKVLEKLVKAMLLQVCKQSRRSNQTRRHRAYPRPAALVESARTCAGEKVANLFDSNILWNR